MFLCCCKIEYLVGGWYEPLLVRERISSGSLTDQYRLIFPSSASPFLPPRREMPPCGGREGGGAPPLDCLLGSSPRHDGDFGWRNVVFLLCV